MQHTPAVNYGRAIRPFQARRLLTALADLQARSAHIAGVMARLAEAEGHGPSAWRYELGEAMDSLAELSEQAGAVFDECSEMYNRADADWDRAVDAMQRVLEGMVEAPAEQAVA